MQLICSSTEPHRASIRKRKQTPCRHDTHVTSLFRSAATNSALAPSLSGWLSNVQISNSLLYVQSISYLRPHCLPPPPCMRICVLRSACVVNRGLFLILAFPLRPSARDTSSRIPVVPQCPNQSHDTSLNLHTHARCITHPYRHDVPRYQFRIFLPISRGSLSWK